MKLPEIKNRVLNELEELYNTPRIKSFTYEVKVSEDSIPTVYYSIEKIMMPEQSTV